MKKLLFLLLALSLTLALLACGGETPPECTDHVDVNSDGVCDNEGCGAPVEVTPPAGGDDDEGGSVTPPAGGDDDEGGPVTPPAGGDDDEGGPVTPPAGGDDDEGGSVTPPATEDADIVGITFEGASFEYDTQYHAITVTGNVPTGVNVVYTGGENGTNGAKNVGSYKITATLSGEGYKTLVLEATITITSEEELLYVHMSGDTLYFENSLDDNCLYTYGEDGVVYLSRDDIDGIVSANGVTYIISKTLFSGSISRITAGGKVESIYDVSASELATDGEYLYYNVNLLSSEKNGIYRLSISDIEDSEAELTPVKLTSVKSEYITYSEGRIYFSNKSDSGKLYSVSASANNIAPTKLYNYKVSDIIADDGVLYFTRDITLSNLTAGAAIYSINVDGGISAEQTDDSSRVTKITMSKGKYLTKIGDYIYFVNTDMVTASLFGDGIYKAPADGSGWIGDSFALLTGATKVIDGAEDKIFSLSTDGEFLYYYRANTKHLYSFDIDSEEEVDLMAGFVPPVKEELILTMNSKTEYYNGEIYYINMLDGGKLYRFNPVTKTDYRLTGAEVVDFAIGEGYIYYTTVRLLVNYDLYRFTLAGGEAELISKDNCQNLSFSDGKIYYTNFSGSNTLNVMNLDGTADTVIFDEEGVNDNKTTIYEGKLYFVADDRLYTYDLTAGTSAVVNKNLKPLEYYIYDGKILLMNCDGLQNHVDIYDIASNKATNLGNLGISGLSDDIRGIFVYNGEFYFYRNVAAGSSKKGLYKVTESGGEYTAALLNTVDGYYVCDSVVVGDKVYFVDVWCIKGTIPTTSSTANIYSLNLDNFKVTQEN